MTKYLTVRLARGPGLAHRAVPTYKSPHLVP